MHQNFEAGEQKLKINGETSKIKGHFAPLYLLKINDLNLLT